MQRVQNWRNTVYRLLIEPRSSGVDERRHEFILNVILSGLLGITLLAVLFSLAILISNDEINGAGSVLFTLVFFGLVIACRWAVWKGHTRFISYLIILIPTLFATQLIVHWGFSLTQALLDYCMVIVIAGILLGARQGLRLMWLVIIALLTIAYLQGHHHLRPDLSWRTHLPIFVDAVGSALILLIIGLVSWLANREIDSALRRARRSEAELLLERDSLEVKVAERTRELEGLQLMRIMELERFAAFGRISAALVHELSSPLMAATLSLQNTRMTGESRLDRVNKSLEQIERHLEAARMQLRGGSVVSTFLVGRELQRVAEMVQPIARRKKVQLEIPKVSQVKLHGDVVKFSQIVSNLLINAVESYAIDGPATKRVVRLSATEQKNGLKLTVRDYGSGISETDMLRIFEPFYSKKPTPEQHSGMGIGLGIVKRFVEEDFDGTLTVTSSPQNGTRFNVVLHSRPKTGHG